jgi:hypothetical protein
MVRTSQIDRKNGRCRAKLVSIETVRHIASVLYKPELNPIIEHVDVIARIFWPTTCSGEKLRIANSAENVYLHAQFLCRILSTVSFKG